jgi:hypothetical protein
MEDNIYKLFAKNKELSSALDESRELGIELRKRYEELGEANDKLVERNKLLLGTIASQKGSPGFHDDLVDSYAEKIIEKEKILIKLNQEIQLLCHVNRGQHERIVRLEKDILKMKSNRGIFSWIRNLLKRN